VSADVAATASSSSIDRGVPPKTKDCAALLVVAPDVKAYEVEALLVAPNTGMLLLSLALLAMKGGDGTRSVTSNVWCGMGGVEPGGANETG
jgi:hypothetical protein